MDNSQSSDVFSDTSISCHNSTDIMDTLSYDTLLNKTKAFLSNVALVRQDSFSGLFTNVLDDCRLCVSQSLDLVVNILLDDNIHLGKLSKYVEDVVCLLGMLSSLVKNIVESVSMSCSSFKTFPTTTGHILILVFTHCKNSESVYGAHLIDVQKPLKDLFRTCHELQLTYLMVLEKHFIFDLTEEKQLEILIEALSINVKIGEVVQSLDVKTMAEQWKGYMALCEKHSSSLMDKQTYQECTRQLCVMIRSNLKTATEIDQDEKVVIRSMKVTNFTIKILLKICVIFKHASVRDPSQIIDLLIDIFFHNPAYLECIEKKPTHFVNAVTTHIFNPSNLLLAELIMDNTFMNVLLTYRINELKDERLLAYLLLIIGIAKCTIQKAGQTTTYPKNKLIHCMFRCLPDCHMWINIGMKFENELYESKQSISLFEYMLMNAIGLSLAMDSEEMGQLEKNMYEAILGTECVTALFSSNLWIAIARMSSNRQFLFTQVISLCQIYQRLETHKTFLYSPQRIYISHTLEGLFSTMRHDDRVRIVKQFDPMEKRNVFLWITLKLSNLPKDLQRNVQEELLERLRTLQSQFPTQESVNELIHVLKLLSTSSVMDDIDLLTHAWMWACPDKYKDLSTSVDSGTLWYFDYVDALASLTSVMEQSFYESSSNLVKVLHVVSNIIKIDNIEFNFLLIDIVCKLATVPVQCENKQPVDTYIKESLKALVESTNDIVRNKLFRAVNACDNKRLEQMLCASISEDYLDMWDSYKRPRKTICSNVAEFKEMLMRSNFKYVHKCIEARRESEHSESYDQIPKTGSSNFDFADLDSLFDNGSDSEPASKKLKIDCDEAERILDRIENDVLLLSNVKENMFTIDHRRRIKSVCDKLKSIVS